MNEREQFEAPGVAGVMVKRLRNSAQGISLGADGMGWAPEDLMGKAADLIETMAAVGVSQEQQIMELERAALAASPVQADLLAFLRGAAPLEGVWFGERHPTRKGAFWWRELLPDAIEQQVSALPCFYALPDDAIANACAVGGIYRLDLMRAWDSLRSDISTPPQEPQAPAPAPSVEAQTGEHHGLDNDRQVFFYEQDFYVLSNFSSFTLMWKGIRFDTSEAAYHWEKFPGGGGDAQLARYFIETAPSAHEAFKIAERNKAHRRPDWDEVKVDIMRDILRAKAQQHEYVRRKLLATGDRELIENSWRDGYWGWGPNRDGKNMLGRLWMEVRAELRAESQR